MKSYLRTICLVLCLLVLSGCGKERSVDELAGHLMNVYPSLPPCSEYIKNGEPYTEGYLSPEDFSYLYVGEKERLPEWDLIEEFRIVLSDTTVPFELHIIKVISATDTDEIAKLLSRRAELIRLHNKTEGDYLAYEPYLYTDGRYAILLVTEDNDIAKAVLKRLL